MTIKQKLLATLGTLVLIIVLLGGYAFTSQQKVEHHDHIISQLNLANTGIYNARLAQAEYIATEDEELLASVQEHTAESQATLNEINSLVSAAHQQDIASILNDINSFQNTFNAFTKTKGDTIAARDAFEESALYIFAPLEDALASVDSNTAQLKIRAFKDAFNEVRVSIWKYNTHPDSDLVDEILEQISELDAQIPALQQTMESAETQQHLAELGVQLTKYRGTFTALTTDNDNLDEAQMNMLMAANTASESITALQKKEEQVTSNVRSSVHWTIIVALIAAVSLGTALATWLINSIMTPLNRSVSFAKSLAEGDLRHSITVDGHDEFSTLNASLNNSVVALQNTVSGIINTANNINQGSNEMLEAIGKSNNALFEQQSNTDMVAAAITEMSTATGQIAENAANAADISRKGAEAGQQGSKVVTRSIKAMSQLNEEMQNAAARVGQLSEDVTNISSILDVIRSIADQTNLLALNAAIEAARAGEQGRGFSVVADEVRTLAQKTQLSIDDITRIIEKLQSGSSEMVSSIDQATSQSQQVVQLTNESSKAYDDIAQMISHIQDMNAQVSVGAEEQSHVSEDVHRNILSVKRLADDNAHELQKVQEKASQQLGLAKQLFEQIRFFKV